MVYNMNNSGTLECDKIILGGVEILIKDGKLVVKK